MALSDRFSCFIVSSEGTLPAQCAEILLGGGHDLCGIVSAEASVRRWAEERGVAYFEPTGPLRDVLSRRSFDYLFSINNYLILREDVLSLPRRLAINYHDSLLPRYAGMYATSWALMNREATHGV